MLPPHLGRTRRFRLWDGDEVVVHGEHSL
jgi:hypothetical protein